MSFEENYNKLLSGLGQGKPMVLSTSLDGSVTSRTVSVVLIDGRFYFQTGTDTRKYAQLCANPNAALCIDNIQIEGTCTELGQPLGTVGFCLAYKTCYPGSYDAYTALAVERLFVLDPSFIQRWTYIDGKPFVEVFRVGERIYDIAPYL